MFTSEAQLVSKSSNSETTKSDQDAQPKQDNKKTAADGETADEETAADRKTADDLA